MMQLRETSSANRLANDPYRGMQDATRNGQTRLALDYAVLVIQDMARKVADLGAKVADLETRSVSSPEQPSEPEPEKKSTRRVVKKDVDDSDTNTD